MTGEERTEATVCPSCLIDEHDYCWRIYGDDCTCAHGIRLYPPASHGRATAVRR